MYLVMRGSRYDSAMYSDESAGYDATEYRRKYSTGYDSGDAANYSDESAGYDATAYRQRRSEVDRARKSKLSYIEEDDKTSPIRSGFVKSLTGQRKVDPETLYLFLIDLGEKEKILPDLKYLNTEKLWEDTREILKYPRDLQVRAIIEMWFPSHQGLEGKVMDILGY